MSDRVTENNLAHQATQMKNWNLVEHFRTLLLPHLKAAPPPATDLDVRRQLTGEPYFCLFLFRMLNPTLTSMRGLCALTKAEKMRSICPQPVSIASFSEAQHLYRPEILGQIVRELAQQAKGIQQFGDPQVRAAVQALTVVDGTIFTAIQRMAWAPASGPGCAIRVNLHFSVFDQVPTDWSFTPGKVSELKEWKRMAQPGSMYVGDRLYSENHLFLKQLQKKNIHFVVRLRGHIIRTPQQEPAPLTEADRKAGVVSDQLVAIGGQEGGPILRLVEIHAAGHIFLLVTTRLDLPAHMIGLIYRYRWQIELYFKWIKTMLPCRHWLALSPAGVAIQIYSVMIAALLLLLHTGHRPTKRQMEALWFYWSGLIAEHELLSFLQKKS